MVVLVALLYLQINLCKCFILLCSSGCSQWNKVISQSRKRSTHKLLRPVPHLHSLLIFGFFGSSTFSFFGTIYPENILLISSEKGSCLAQGTERSFRSNNTIWGILTRYPDVSTTHQYPTPISHTTYTHTRLW